MTGPAQKHRFDKTLFELAVFEVAATRNRPIL
jgi:hypothetical protein